MTHVDCENLSDLIREAARRYPEREWAARNAAEHYYGLITCGPYMPAVRALAASVL